MDRILNNLEYMTDGIAEAAEKAIRSETLRISRSAKALAPVDSGRLRNSITTRVTREPSGDIVGTAGTNVSYAPYNEFGTGPVGAAAEKDLPPGRSLHYRSNGWAYKDPETGERRYTLGQRPKPFLYPAFKANLPHAREAIQNAVKSALRGE